MPGLIGLRTEDNAVFISNLFDPHAEHSVNLLMKSQLLRSITRGVGLLALFPWSFWGEEQFGTGTLTFFILSRFLGRNSSDISLSGWHLSHFQGGTVKKSTLYLENTALKTLAGWGWTTLCKRIQMRR